MTPEELLEHAISFAFYPSGAKEDEINGSNFRIGVERRGLGDTWAVTHLGECWDGEDWVYESLPSNRTDEFKAKTRFPLTTAIELANRLVDTVVVNGATYAQWEARFAAMDAAAAAKE